MQHWKARVDQKVDWRSFEAVAVQQLLRTRCAVELPLVAAVGLIIVTSAVGNVTDRVFVNHLQPKQVKSGLICDNHIRKCVGPLQSCCNCLCLQVDPSAAGVAFCCPAQSCPPESASRVPSGQDAQAAAAGLCSMAYLPIKTCGQAHEPAVSFAALGAEPAEEGIGGVASADRGLALEVSICWTH